MKPGDWAWVSLGTGIFIYEIACPRGELLSEACDRYRNAHPLLTYAGIIYVAAHLARIIPEQVDPLTRLADWLGR